MDPVLLANAPLAQITLAAVGSALTAWEYIEAALSELYTVLVDDPGGLEILAKYGREGRVFSARVAVVEASVHPYFVSRPDQDHEGDVAAVLKRARELSAVRNRIAHGTVSEIVEAEFDDDGEWEDQHSVFNLTAPWFAEKQLANDWPGLSAEQIIQHACEFRELERDIEALINRLLPPSWR